MDWGVLGALAGLALVDSTSVGTLVLPVVMLLQPQVRAAKFGLYLITIAGFYWLLGLGLLLGAERLLSLVSALDGVRALDWVQLVLGLAMLAFAFWPDTKWAKARAAQRSGTSRADRWSDRVVGPQARNGVVVAVALGAGAVEAASMLPYLAAIGLLSTSAWTLPSQLSVLTGYVAVMCLPAVGLLGVRLAVGDRAEPALGRLKAWLTKMTSGAIWWVIGLLGFWIAGDAVGRLGLG